jgi:hypothetical protein
MTPKKQVSPAIRILRGKRDASARATHLEAATRKFLVTTNERKQMSTKTHFKRIALVAVAALGMGVLSSVPSQALFSGNDGSKFTLSTTAATGALEGATSDSTTAGTLSISGLALVGTESFTVSTVAKSFPKGNTSAPALRLLVVDSVGTTGGAPTLTGSHDGTAAATTAAYTQLVADSRSTMIALATGAGYLAVKYKFFQDTASTQRLAGTYVYTAIVTPYGGNPSGVVSVAQTIDLTVTIAAAASASTTVSPSLSTAFIGTSSTSNTADSAIVAEATASATPAAYISVRTYNAASSAAAESITVTISTAGTLFYGSVGGSSITIAGDGSEEIQVRPDGRSGVAVINVSTTTRTFAAKNVTFYAKAAKTLTASVFNPTLTLGSNPSAIAVTAVDANGTNWAGAAYIVASSATDALVGGSATTPVACTYELIAETKTHFCPVSTIATGTAKFKVIDAATVALATATSNEVTVTVANNPVASVKLAFNKATYQAGEKAYITVTALDAAGKTLQGQNFANLLATGGITSSYAFGASSDTLTAVSITTSAYNSATAPATAGAKTYTVYMPTTGSVKITATGGASVALSGQVEVSATATVADSATAALAAVNALATTVASLRTLITTLTNLVLKIQKKVKA